MIVRVETIEGVSMSVLKSISALMAIIGCSKATVYRRVRAGKIPHRRIGRLIRFSDDDIQSYLESVSVKVEKEDHNEK